MKTYTLVAPCLFGLEGIVADELRRMGMNGVSAENGRVLFEGGDADIARANIGLRCAERVLIRVAEFPAETFDQLFEGAKEAAWEDFLPRDAGFPVTGHSLNSKLFSIPHCQSIVKKAVVERMKSRYKTDWFPEDGARHSIRFAIMKDAASVYLDTSGSGLHKRGYRAVGVSAPLRETLAAAMVMLSKYRGRRWLHDPFCGSGTIAIEAAMIARGLLPGAKRGFDAEKFMFVDKGVWKARDEARLFSGDYRITGADIDPSAVKQAGENAKLAGVGDIISFSAADSLKALPEAELYVTNPPYGERLGDKAESENIYRGLGRLVGPDAGMYILSPYPEFERIFGRAADKKRKLYNGMIKCNLYIYRGAPKPPGESPAAD